jgi:transcriptional regulator with XRE-family HTH domain
METTPGKRVRMFREAKGYKTASAFAEAAGLKVATLSSIETDRTSPSFDILAILATSFPDLNTDWLLTGKGDMLRPAAEGQPFFQGGTRTPMGAYSHEPGSIEAQLGANFGEDLDGKKIGTPPVKDAQGFIAQLLAEVETLKKENKALSAVIQEQRESMREQRENNAFLRRQLAAMGKTEGSQEQAPEQSTPAVTTNPIGFVVVRAMYPDGLPEQLEQVQVLRQA